MMRFKLLLALFVLSVIASPVWAEIKFQIGEPAANSTNSGIGQISGWAVSDQAVVSVEAFIDGVSVGLVPYGGTRMDVADAFPDFPNSDLSGWSMKWNYSLLSEGEHEITVIVTDIDGNQLIKDVVFTTTAFKSQFIADPEAVDLSAASVSSPEQGKILITGAVVDGEVVDIELCWTTATQQFQIEKIIREEEEPEKENQAPNASAGDGFNVEPGATVVIEGNAIDPDGSVVGYSWKQVNGTDVELTGADQRIVQFIAPETTGSIRLRLTAYDNGGASDDDDVVIEVVDTSPEPEPDPELENVAPIANAGSDTTVETDDTVRISGSAVDSDGTIEAWLWEVVSGTQVDLTNANTYRVTFRAPQSEGFVELRLTVTDDDGAIGSDNVTINFEVPAPAPNQEPSANAGSNRTVSAGDSVTITGGGSDPDGTISFWEWEQVSGTSVDLNNAQSQQVQFTAPETEGEIRLRLTVTDNEGASDSDEVVINVQIPEPPDENTTGDTLNSMLSSINAARSQARKCGDTDYPAQPDFQWSSSLADIAMQHSMDMASKGYFSHTSADGTTIGERVLPYWSGLWVGENIAASSIDQSDSYVVNLWLNSVGHCKLIMSPNFTHVGAGVGRNTQNGYSYHHFWTLDFGG